MVKIEQRKIKYHLNILFFEAILNAKVKDKSPIN